MTAWHSDRLDVRPARRTPRRRTGRVGRGAPDRPAPPAGRDRAAGRRRRGRGDLARGASTGSTPPPRTARTAAGPARRRRATAPASSPRRRRCGGRGCWRSPACSRSRSSRPRRRDEGFCGVPRGRPARAAGRCRGGVRRPARPDHGRSPLAAPYPRLRLLLIRTLAVVPAVTVPIVAGRAGAAGPTGGRRLAAPGAGLTAPRWRSRPA